MPSLKIVTNVARAKIPGDMLQESSRLFQEAMGKPMQYISVCIVPDQLVAFGGTTEACALIEVTSIGKLGVEENKAIAKVIFDLIKEKLGIEPTRAYIQFTDKPRSEIGYNGTTFHK